MEHLMLIQPGGNGATDHAASGVVVPSWLPWALVGLGVVVLGAVAVMLVRGRGTAIVAGQQRQAAGELADLKNQLVDVKKLAATVADDLDRRAARLERLIAQADEVLARSAEDDRSDEARSGPARTRGNNQATPPLAPVDDLAQRVFTLADQGRSAVQIAQALRQPVGNVELMLALRGER